jgi:2-polyprenyl-3-methyl-5-hydroxy-6-metoxy-1,4-benzoquinol methylase
LALHAWLKPTPAELATVYRSRYGHPRTTGPLPRFWHRLGYFVPDVFYEAVVTKLVRKEATWLDVGCGRALFPSNPRLAPLLAQQCRTLVGVDPDGAVEENPLVHLRAKSTIEDFRSTIPFDLVTLRMVAEHISQPHRALPSLARLTKPGGKVVVYTVNYWSPVALLAAAVPFQLHHALKRVLWKTEERDTFSVAYRMNSRRRLRQLFECHGFREVYFRYLHDCCIFHRFHLIHCLELLLWQTLKILRMPYPETCMLGVYERL